MVSITTRTPRMAGLLAVSENKTWDKDETESLYCGKLKLAPLLCWKGNTRRYLFYNSFSYFSAVAPSCPVLVTIYLPALRKQ
jgi:hypothetical protein